MKLKTIFFVLVLFCVVSSASAQELSQSTISSVKSAYRFLKDVRSIAVRVPTVVEIPIVDEFIERTDFAVLDTTVNTFEPHFFKQETLVNTVLVEVSTNPISASASRLNDNDTQTYADFLLPDDTLGVAQITLLSKNSITSSSLTTLLGDNVALPNSIEIHAFVEDQDTIVVAKRGMDQQTIRFPQTTSPRWVITLRFSQPLRITELQLHQDNATLSSTRTLRFLAQPAHSYQIYFDPDRSVTPPVGEAGNLVSSKDVLVQPAITSKSNPQYRIADVDSDGIPDIRDNCVSVANADQQDTNTNGRGDVCDDFDQDGLINSQDNCPNNPNQLQTDTDSDGIGDVCDSEESRITERNTWIPWVGIVFAVLVVIILLVLTVKSTHVSKQGDNE
ncbi:MAG: thrombospondin type 3 repeat-containing protein [Patescibacteria group bacterium]